MTSAPERGSTFEVLNASTGTPLYSFSTGATIYGAPSVANGEIFVGATNKNVYAFGLGGSPPPPPPPPSCPLGWNCADVGTPAPAGSQSTSGSTWTVNGGGADIWGTSDQFHYVWQSMTNNTSVSARVISQTNTNAWAKAGVMLRTSTDPASPFYSVYVTPANGIAVQYRATAATAAVMAANPGAATAPTLPQYLQVTDVNNVLTAYTSADGVHFSPIANSSVTLANLGVSLLGGVAVSSHNSAALSTLTLDSVTVGSTTPPPPGCPLGWSCADIGTVSVAGNQSLSGGTWTLSGSGGDIWITADQFHYVWQLPAQADNQSISARIVSQTNTNAWAKAGVMFRSTSDPGSPEYALLVTPGNGIVVQWRSVQGGTTSRIATIAGTVPAYLRITRTIDANGVTTLTAFTSPDGSTWTALAGSQITWTPAAPTGAMIEGLAVTSHQWNALSTVTMDSVAAS